ncbi:hypothetical protein BH09ACT7_BH09ACT7_18310 [soil metagenome]
MTNPESDPTPNPIPNPSGDVPAHLQFAADVLAPGRADFLRAASAVVAGDGVGLSQVLAELSIHHPSAWQYALSAAVGEYVQLLLAVHGHDLDTTAKWLNEEAFKAIGHADGVARRRQGGAAG